MRVNAATTGIDFDIELAKKQSNENPVYYVQYAHARIASILRKAAEAGMAPPAADDPQDDGPDDQSPEGFDSDELALRRMLQQAVQTVDDVERVVDELFVPGRGKPRYQLATPAK